MNLTMAMAPESFTKDQWDKREMQFHSSAPLMKSTAAAPRSSSSVQKKREENPVVFPLKARVILFHIKAGLDGCGFNSIVNK